MLKIKIKYKNEKELKALVEVLKPYITRSKSPINYDCSVKSAYLEIEIE